MCYPGDAIKRTLVANQKESSCDGSGFPLYPSGPLPCQEGMKCFYLTTHSTHFIYGYMASDIW